MYAYETDGFGNAYFMDDANVPSLLSLPYLGYISKNDPIYLKTRKSILSDGLIYFNSPSRKSLVFPRKGCKGNWFPSHWIGLYLANVLDNASIDITIRF
jgi:uncharacterized protein